MEGDAPLTTGVRRKTQRSAGNHRRTTRACLGIESTVQNRMTLEAGQCERARSMGPRALLGRELTRGRTRATFGACTSDGQARQPRWSRWFAPSRTTASRASPAFTTRTRAPCFRPAGSRHTASFAPGAALAPGAEDEDGSSRSSTSSLSVSPRSTSSSRPPWRRAAARSSFWAPASTRVPIGCPRSPTPSSTRSTTPRHQAFKRRKASPLYSLAPIGHVRPRRLRIELARQAISPRPRFAPSRPTVWVWEGVLIQPHRRGCANDAGRHRAVYSQRHPSRTTTRPMERMAERRIRAVLLSLWREPSASAPPGRYRTAWSRRRVRGRERQ